jgi:hypothetical protein
MTIITATIREGRLEVAVPADWPDGTEVAVYPLSRRGEGEDDAMTAEEIARTLSAMDQMEPLEMSEAEREAWEAELEGRKRREKAGFIEHAETLRRAWK